MTADAGTTIPFVGGSMDGEELIFKQPCRWFEVPVGDDQCCWVETYALTKVPLPRSWRKASKRVAKNRRMYVFVQGKEAGTFRMFVGQQP